MSLFKTLQPAGWTRPRGYANGISARGRQIHVAGQIGWDEKCAFHSDLFVDQVRQALKNVVDVLAEDAAGPQHIVRMTWYLLDKHEYLAAGPGIGRAYREVIGNHYPAMTAVQVAGLIEERARVEIEVTAVVPE